MSDAGRGARLAKDGFAGTGRLTQPREPSRLRFLSIALVVPIGFVVLVFWLSMQSRHAEGARMVLRASYQRRLVITELLGRIADAETAQRGYVITGDRLYLAPYDHARIQVDGKIGQLASAFTDEPQQARLLIALQRIVDAKFTEMSGVIQLRDRYGLPAAAASVTAGRGRHLMDRARAVITVMKAIEQRSLTNRIAATHMRSVGVQRTVWILMIVLAAVLASALAIVWRSRRRNFLSALAAFDTSVRLRSIFESITDGVVIVNPAGMIDTINGAAARMLGYEPENLIGLRADKIFDMAGNGDTLFDRLSDPSPALAGDRIVHGRSGGDVHVDIAFGRMSLADGEHIVATLRDISDRREIERLKDEFVSTVSHELRTPLTSVVGSLGLLRAGSVGELPDAAHRLVEIAENNSRRLIRLINDILDFEKIGSGRMRFDRTRLDILPLLANAVRDSSGLASAHRVHLEMKLGHLPRFVEGDADRLTQVVINLLSNAIRHSPEGGTVSLSLTAEGGRTTVAIDDQGAGVPPEFHDRIFKRFAQASEGAAAGGTGLGLAISREIIIAHGGEIWFGRAPSGGARFAFALGLMTDPAPLRDRDTEQPRILVCEDDADVAGTIRLMVEREGCLVDCVGNIREAQAAARSGRYDGIILDLQLPDARGLGAVKLLRADPATLRLPLIVVSAFAADGRIDPDAIALDVIDWIEKPVDSPRLVEAVRIAVGRSSSARPTLLHVDDDADMLEVTATVLADQGRMLRATSLAAAREVLAAHVPDIVILDLNLPDGNGSELLSDLFTADGIAIPTIIYSAHDTSTELSRRVDAVFVKSRRSLPNLAGTIRQILAGKAKDPGTS